MVHRVYTPEYRLINKECPTTQTKYNKEQLKVLYDGIFNWELKYE